MGIIFGVTGTREPAFLTLVTNPAYHIRQYQPFFIAEVPLSPQNGEAANSAFGVLAKYIGVFGQPMNDQEKPMAMTAPVLMEPTSRPTSTKGPILSNADSMSFVVPFEYQTLQSIPKPIDKRVRLRAIPSRFIASRQFSGWYSESAGSRQLDELVKALKTDKLLKDDADESTVKWTVAQYHPPFTLPFLRRNEIWIELTSGETEAVKQLLSKHGKNQK